ncbi:hypothetical protein [Aquabacterium sp. J223]|nr:hypothetical protein [Aquabacterium sp. J223]
MSRSFAFTAGRIALALFGLAAGTTPGPPMRSPTGMPRPAS